EHLQQIRSYEDGVARHINTHSLSVAITARTQATLNDTQVAQDFVATLPVTLPWFRNAGIEYITELPAP
ncbi:hypothetical protein IWX65_003592, partial [Arthrobacter sp. CAN_A214]